MKFNSTPLLLSVIALLGASVAIADAVMDSYGCSEDDYCWASCKQYYDEDLQTEVIEPDLENAYEEGDDWCWLETKPSLDGQYGYAECGEGCNPKGRGWSCEFSCGP